MIVRKIKKEELNERNIISSVCFEMPYLPQTSDELCKKYSNPDRRIERDWQNRWCAFLDDGKTMISSIGSFPYDVYFDEKKVKMGAISGVITMPQYRNQGAVRECLKQAFAEMYEQGVPFSYLYPFSTKYYNKFGYEKVMKKVVWTLPISSITKKDIGGTVKFYQPGDDISDLKSIYDTCMSVCNFAVDRSDIDWKSVTKSFSLDNSPQHFTYSFVSNDNIPKSFITFTKQTDTFNRKLMVCRNFFSIDFEGLCGILQFVRGFSSNYEAIQFTTPEHFRPENAFDEFACGYEYAKSSFHGMARVIDVQKVLELARYNGSGKVTFSISDPYCEWNDGTFVLSFSNGKFERISRLSSDVKPDAKMGIGDFTASISGRYSIDDFGFVPDVTLNGNIENLSKVFYRKKMFIWDLF